MAIRDDARDPWGLVVAALAVGLAWAVGVSLAAAVVIGAAVLAVKLVADVVTSGVRSPAPGRLQRPPRNSAAGVLLARAEVAVRSIHDQAETVAPGPAREQLAAAVTGAESALDGMRRLAAQAAIMDAALQRIDRSALQAEADRLEAAGGGHSPADLQDETKRSVAAIREQIAVADRLSAARESLLARAQTATLGLEGLVARLVEVVALTATAGGVDTVSSKISDLSNELEGLRAGLAETEALSKRAIERG